ncbi:hypothetical protein ACC771_12015, partial [Rhizobium ruizarguesonis]
MNADNINDFTDSDVTVIDTSYRTQTVQHRSGDNTLLSQTITKTSIDGKSITISEDAIGADQDLGELIVLGVAIG